MKVILALFCILSAYEVFAQGDAPPFTQGQKQTTGDVATRIRVPNNQSTKLSSSQALIETGNRNLLANPGFEHQNFATSWTTAGSAIISTEASAPLNGNKSFKAVMAANAVQIYQDSTLYAGVLAGTQGVIRFSASNTAPGATCYQRAAGVKLTGANNKVTLATDGLKRSYEIPVVLSATSNGVECDTGTTAGTLILDDFEISDSLSLPEVSQAQLVVSGNFAAAGSSTLARTNTALGAFTTAAAFPAPTYSINDWGCAATDANKFAITCSNVPAGRVVFRAYSVFFMSSGTADTTLAIFDGTTNAPSQQGINNTTGAPTVVYGEFNYTSAGSRTFEVYASASTGTINMSSTITSGGGGNPRFEIIYYPPASKIYSQRCTSAVDCENEFSARVSSTGVVSGENLDWINGNCSVASGVFTCTFNSGIFTVAPNCTATVNESSSASLHWNIEFQSGQPTSSGFVAVTATTSDVAGSFIVDCQKTGVDFKEKSQITGTFREVMTAPGVSKPIQFGFRSSAICSSGSCPGTFFGDTIGAGSTVFTSTGVFTTTIPAGKCAATPWCEGGLQAFSSTQFRCNISPSSATSITTTCFNNTPAVVNEGFHFMCWCQAP